VKDEKSRIDKSEEHHSGFDLKPEREKEEALSPHRQNPKSSSKAAWLQFSRFSFNFQYEPLENNKYSVAGGGPPSVLFSKPLNGGSLDEWVTVLAEVRDRFQGILFMQLDRQRCRPAFAEAATRRQAQGFSEDHTGPSACDFSTVD
jgi:hypothetical protein